MRTGKWTEISRFGSRRILRRPGSRSRRSAARSNCATASANGLCVAGWAGSLIATETDPPVWRALDGAMGSVIASFGALAAFNRDENARDGTILVATDAQ